MGITRIGLLLLLLTFTTAKVNGQAFVFSLGYNSHFSTPNGLNYIVDRYNETRSYLTQEMEHFNMLDGFTFNTFLGAGGLGLDFGYDRRTQMRSAMSDNRIGQPLERQVKAVMNTAHFGLSAGIPLENQIFALGARTNIGGLKIRSRMAREEVVRDERWEDLYGKIYMDWDINFKYITRYIVIEIYYIIPGDAIFSNIANIAEVNRKLNPSTYQDDPESIPFEASGFGIKLKFAISNAGYQ